VEPNTGSPLLELDNFIATPHLGASTIEAQRKVSEDVCRQVADYLLKNAVSGALNFPQLDLGQVESYQHFVDLAARIATFTSQISNGRLKSVPSSIGKARDMNLNYLTSVMVQRILVPYCALEVPINAMLPSFAESKSSTLGFPLRKTSRI
jgi:D-3-phosphoglycerate dehydrogenase